MGKKLTKTAINAALKASSLITQLDKLSDEREKFEQGLQARSNEKLYAICGETYGMYLKAKETSEVLKETVTCMTKILEKRGLRVQANSSALGVFVRYVFNSERQVTHVYTTALQYLLSEKVAAEDAAEHIKNKGGVHECFKAIKPSEKEAKRKQEIEDAMPLVEEQLAPQSCKPIGKVKVNPAFVANTYKEHGGLILMIGRADAQGSVDVLSPIPTISNSVMTWAKSEIALFLAKEQEKTQTKQKELRQGKAIEKAVAKVQAANQEKIEAGTATVSEATA